ncbi:MAG: hypothetical protein JEZ03_12960 [Bacteroidales bacterium]|nr:hypothetical protein [Bacteroidales bacterium]
MRKIGLFIFLYFTLVNLFGQQDINFLSLNNSQNLSQNRINKIIQDQNGLIWIATEEGLNRYDGINIKNYYHNPADSNSLSNNNIKDMELDSSGIIWIATFGGGLNRFNPVTETFNTYLYSDIEGSADNAILDVCVDQQQDIWCLRQQGAYVFNPGTENFTSCDSLISDANKFNYEDLYHFTKFGDSLMLLAFDRFIKVFDIRSPAFSNYTIDTKMKNRIIDIEHFNDSLIFLAVMNQGAFFFHLKKNQILEQIQAEKTNRNSDGFSIRKLLHCDDILWMGGYNGLIRYDLKSKEAVLHQHNVQKINSLAYNGIIDLFQDKYKNIWIGTNGMGVNYISPYTRPFELYNEKPGLANSLNFESIRFIYVDELQNLWIGGYGGIDVFDKTGNKKIVINTGAYYSIHQDQQNPDLFLIGSEGNGFIRYDRATSAFSEINYSDHIDKDHVWGGSVRKIKSDPIQQDWIWFGTNNGFGHYSKAEKEFYYPEMYNNPESVIPKDVKALLVEENQIWIGCNQLGLFRYFRKTGEFIHYISINDDPSTLSSNTILDIYRDRSGILWVATAFGLNKMNENLGSFQKYTKDDGLPNNTIYSIIEDHSNNLWLSTNHGICKFNPATLKVHSFNVTEGLQDNEFNHGAAFIDSSGKIYFGGIKGVSAFFPEKINKNNIPPDIVLTEITVMNQTQNIPDSFIKDKIIHLDYREKYFSLSFAAINYFNSEKNTFAYKILDLHDDWIKISNRNTIDFNYLDPGDYELMVTASNSDGIWNEEALIILLIIDAPFWKTTSFYIANLIVFIIVILIIAHTRSIAHRRRNKLLTRLVNEKTSELLSSNNNLQQEIEVRIKTETELIEANQTKDKFFSIIGHDLRNPIHALVGLSTLLEESYDELKETDRRELIANMAISGEVVQNLVENLLHWSRLQTGKLEAHPKKFIINQTMERAIQLLKSNSEEKDIHIKTEIEEPIEIFADSNMVETIFRNLISNAIKFTPKKGEITLSAEIKAKMIIIHIADTGIGIDSTNLDRIFDNKKGLKSYGTNREPGTGLGLVLCKEFIELNGGKIWVESTVGESSVFSFSLPLAENEVIG